MVDTTQDTILNIICDFPVSLTQISIIIQFPAKKNYKIGNFRQIYQRKVNFKI